MPEEKRRPLVSVTIKDMEMQTFSVGGCGGSGKDTSNSGCRLVHRASGATGEGRVHRSLTRNRQEAFGRLALSDKFQKWIRAETARVMGKPIAETPDQIRARVNRAVDEGLRNGTIVVETRDGVDGVWLRVA
jgi:protein subunit release factor A